MFGLHARSAKGDLVAVVDIGSGSAGVGLVSLASGTAELVASARASLPFEERSKDAMVTGIAAQISAAGKSALAQYVQAGEPQSISKVYAILRAPWTNSKTTMSSGAFPEDTRITEQLIGQLAQEALGKEQEIDRKNLLEASVVRVLLNGYPCAKPIGMRAKEIDVSALLSDCDPEMRAAAQTAIEGLFPAAQIVWRSGVRALLEVVGKRAEHSQSYLIVDMEGEGTSLVSVRKGIMAGYALVPEGVRTILKKISSGLPEETLSTMRMIARDQCEGEACDSLNAAIARVEPDLARIFGEIMGKQATTRRFPSDLVLVAHPDIAPWLSRFFARIDFTQFTLTAQPFSVEVLTPEDLSQWVSVIPGNKTDIGLLIGGALVNIERR